MTAQLRPIHSSFETLRHAREISRGYHHFGSATNEQLTARGFGRTSRPAAIFSDFRAR
ncbi:hypothetical protein MRS76_04640 [Rhizobiaceae bacterium n13]|uniref:Uncharacterized protein n=1 Tax=Ferirhizobium litorale TaxID=2927786 RepID=A0AAE3Q8U7_9HYPH|nr:hypothetical protein [Fererhizobium litorale]MDI7861235.1 hypothetical protein [Fererhizobium litorale]MDI7921382.1 hypothetical protein [Fererhizobium litorale]